MADLAYMPADLAYMPADLAYIPAGLLTTKPDGIIVASSLSSNTNHRSWTNGSDGQKNFVMFRSHFGDFLQDLSIVLWFQCSNMTLKKHIACPLP